ncbi:MAG: metallophosphoesterase [Verrucomicrobia bacterium]|nr:metallophosphoesterase [Verrucomicrobiota bacterium]
MHLRSYASQKKFAAGKRVLLLAFTLALNFSGCAQNTPPAAAAEAKSFQSRTFTAWKDACAKLPTNRALKGSFPPKELLPLQSFREMENLVDAYFQQCRAGQMSPTNAWVGEAPSRAEFFNTDAAYFLKPPIPFQPFAQKLVVPADAEIVFHGDFHGDVHSLIAFVAWLNRQNYLQEFKIIKPRVWLVFLGDYTDRGMFGVEVLYTLLRLKVENPDNVVLLRGNHEDVSIAARYGFLQEGQMKYGREFNAKKVMRLYDFLPVALFLGSGDDFLQCVHGGMEPGFNPRALLDAPGTNRFQLVGALNQETFLKAHAEFLSDMPANARTSIGKSLRDFMPQSPIEPMPLGFMWNDFTIVRGGPGLEIDPGRAMVYGDRATQFILREAGGATKIIHAVLRAHQHSAAINPMMRRLIASGGVFRHWQAEDSVSLLDAPVGELEKNLERDVERPLPTGSVWTFNVAPDTVYGEGCKFDTDSWAILKVKETFAEWRLRVVSQNMTK